jgi:hypothetical protein
MTATDAAIRAYADDALLLRIAADELRVEGFPMLARQHRQWALVVDRARRAEITDPAPDVALEKCPCETCQAHYFGVRWETLTGGGDV